MVNLNFNDYVDELDRMFYDDKKKMICFIFKDKAMFCFKFKSKDNYNLLKCDLTKVGDHK